jgi:hypothetical protein
MAMNNNRFSQKMTEAMPSKKGPIPDYRPNPAKIEQRAEQRLNKLAKMPFAIYLRKSPRARNSPLLSKADR